jgi:heat shock protein HslJ
MTRRTTALAIAAAALIAAAGCGSGPARTATPGSEQGPPLAGTEWLLTSYRAPGGDPVAVRADLDATLRFDGRGHYSAHACNYIGGDAAVDGDRVMFTPGMSTSMLCTPDTVEKQFLATTKGEADWAIADRTLTLTSLDGHELTYRVRPSIYPDLTARTIVAGEHGGGQYRLAAGGPDGDGGLRYLTIEARTGPGVPWGVASVAAPFGASCLANSVTAGETLGGDSLLATWATPAVARVTLRAAPGAPETALTFHDVPGTDLRIASLWTRDFRFSVSPVTFYDADGKVLAAYPKGPC